MFHPPGRRKSKDATLDQAEAHERRLKEALDAQHAEIVKIRRALSTFDPEYVHPQNTAAKKRKSTTQPRPGATGFGISVEAVRPIVSACKELNDRGTFTQGDVIELLNGDADQGKVSNAFKFLRAIEFIRKTGRRDNRDEYAIMDEGAFERYLEANREAVTT